MIWIVEGYHNGPAKRSVAYALSVAESTVQSVLHWSPQNLSHNEVLSFSVATYAVQVSLQQKLYVVAAQHGHVYQALHSLGLPDLNKLLLLTLLSNPNPVKACSGQSQSAVSLYTGSPGGNVYVDLLCQILSICYVKSVVT